MRDCFENILEDILIPSNVLTVILPVSVSAVALLHAHILFMFIASHTCTVGLNAWFNDCVLCWSSRITNLIIALANPVPNYRIRARLCLRI